MTWLHIVYRYCFFTSFERNFFLSLLWHSKHITRDIFLARVYALLIVKVSVVVFVFRVRIA